MGSTDDLKIESATPAHIPEICAIAGQRALTLLSAEQAREQGFLVSQFQEPDYRAFLCRSDHFYVAVDGGAVCGFVLAFSRERLGADSRAHAGFMAEETGPYVLIKQTAVGTDHAGRGIATRLYEHLFARAEVERFVAVIVLDPPNERSIRFHERLGFEKIGQFTPADHMPRGIWIRKGRLKDWENDNG
jgi:predicted GNAT superfamily acetyltransferase